MSSEWGLIKEGHMVQEMSPYTFILCTVHSKFIMIVY